MKEHQLNEVLGILRDCKNEFGGVDGVCRAIQLLESERDKFDIVTLCITRREFRIILGAMEGHGGAEVTDLARSLRGRVGRTDIDPEHPF